MISKLFLFISQLLTSNIVKLVHVLPAKTCLSTEEFGTVGKNEKENEM